MADDVAPADMQDKPIDATEAPETGQAETSEESFTDFDTSQIPEDADRDWFEQKYNELRAGFTKKTQEFGEVRREAERAQQLVEALRNPRTAPAVLAQLGVNDRELLEAYGYDLADDEDDFDEFDPDDRIERLERTLAEQQEAAQRQQYEAWLADEVAGQIESLEKKEGREFDAEEHRLLDTYARANPKPDGSPDVEGAYSLLSGIVKAREKALLDPKRKAPRAPGQGKAATRRVDPSKETPEERMERLMHAADQARGSLAA